MASFENFLESVKMWFNLLIDSFFGSNVEKEDYERFGADEIKTNTDDSESKFHIQEDDSEDI